MCTHGMCVYNVQTNKVRESFAAKMISLLLLFLVFSQGSKQVASSHYFCWSWSEKRQCAMCKTDVVVRHSHMVVLVSAISQIHISLGLDGTL